MAKKNTNNKELVQVALDSHKWINTPVVYTTFGKDFNNFQQDVMLQVSGHLQEYMKQYLDDGRYLSKEPPPKPMFSKEEIAAGIPTVRLNLSEFGLRYDYDVESALKSITELWVRKPVFDPQTGIKKGEDIFPVFKKVFVPKSTISAEGEALRYKGKDKIDEKTGELIKYNPERVDGYIEVTINEEVAAYAFDMSRGYFNHLERIAYFCNSAHTSRLYLLLMTHVSRGQMSPQIKYMELKDYLGMFRRNKETDEVESVMYEKYSQFSKQVLNVAQKDLLRLADENKTEIVFEYEPVYRGFKKRGDPDFIKFSITRTELGKARDIQLHRKSKEEKLITFLQARYANLDVRIASMVVGSVSDDQWNAFYMFVTKSISKMVEDVKPDDPAAYLVANMRKWINDHKEPETEPSLFEEVDFVEVESRPLTPVDTKHLASSILDNLRYEFGNGQMGYDYFFSKRTAVTINGNVAVMTTHESVIGQLMTNINVDKINKAVKAVLGADATFEIRPL